MKPLRTFAAALAIASVGWLTSGGCAAEPAARAAPAAPARKAEVVPEVPFDQPFRLAYSHAARVKGTRTRVRYVELLEDSRCPAGVTCVWAGRVRVRIEVQRGNAKPASIELSTTADANLADAGGVTWELRELQPARVAGEHRVPADTTLILVAHPLQAR
jgi:hypothetical protein